MRTAYHAVPLHVTTHVDSNADGSKKRIGDRRIHHPTNRHHIGTRGFLALGLDLSLRIAARIKRMLDYNAGWTRPIALVRHILLSCAHNVAAKLLSKLDAKCMCTALLLTQSGE